MSKNSARKSTATRSLTLVVFTREKSQFCWKGPRKVLRPTFPKAAKPVQSADARETITFWLSTQLPPAMNLFKSTKLLSRLSVLSGVKTELNAVPAGSGTAFPVRVLPDLPDPALEELALDGKVPLLGVIRRE